MLGHVSRIAEVLFAGAFTFRPVRAFASGRAISGRGLAFRVSASWTICLLGQPIKSLHKPRDNLVLTPF